MLALARRLFYSSRVSRLKWFNRSIASATTYRMPRKLPRNAESTKAARAKQYLSGGGVAREDSDDELGLEDHPWQWIYSPDQDRTKGQPEIIGARMGDFQCTVGDCVLLKAEGGANEAWIGLICEFQDDEQDEKAANFMWFSTEREIRNKQKKRTDSLPVCNSGHVSLIETDSPYRTKSILPRHGT